MIYQIALRRKPGAGSRYLRFGVQSMRPHDRPQFRHALKALAIISFDDFGSRAGKASWFSNRGINQMAELRAGQLKIVLRAFEPAPLPIQVCPAARLLSA